MRYVWTLSWLILITACGDASGDNVTEYYLIDDAGNDDAKKKEIAKPEGGEAPSNLGLTFVSPAAATDGGGIVAVVVAFEGALAADTWSLFFDTSANSTTGKAIAEDLPVSTTSADWDTSTLAAGSYYMYAEVTRDGATTRHRAVAAVTVAPADPTNAKPTVKITIPNGENVFVAGTPATLTYAGQDADGDALKYKLEYSSDGGVTWSMIADAVTASTYDWNVTGLVQGTNYRVRVTAQDAKGATAQAVSAKSFGVASTPVTFATTFGAMMTTRCGSCHAVGKPNAAKFRSDNLALANIGVNDQAGKIRTRIENGTMPPAGALGAVDKQVLTLWIWSGAK